MNDDCYDLRVCVICKKDYCGYGNNAEPFASGLCCDDCNLAVIKERIKQIHRRLQNES